jgi:hypothetical protein
MLTVNDDTSGWQRTFPDYGVILDVTEMPDMDAIRDRLTADHDEPVLLRSVVKDHPDDNDNDDDDDDGDGDDSDDGAAGTAGGDND